MIEDFVQHPNQEYEDRIEAILRENETKNIFFQFDTEEDFLQVTSRANIDFANLGDYMKMVFARFKDALRLLKNKNPVP